MCQVQCQSVKRRESRERIRERAGKQLEREREQMRNVEGNQSEKREKDILIIIWILIITPFLSFVQNNSK